jgi:hypothetical protein
MMLVCIRSGDQSTSSPTPQRTSMDGMDDIGWTLPRGVRDIQRRAGAADVPAHPLVAPAPAAPAAPAATAAGNSCDL